MSRYINAELAKETIREYLKTEPPMPSICKKVMDIAIGAVDLTPTADVVEVVRCKDCEHWKDTSDDTVTEAHWGECRKPLGDYRYSETAENDYCSYGERREK